MSNNIEANRQNFNIDWRAEKASYDNQMEHFYMNEEFSDVNFVFNRQETITKIPAHKFAIVVASEVFQKEFTYGGGTEEAQKRSKTIQIVEITDENVEVESFKAMLLFIYSGYNKLDLSGDIVLSLLYIAMKYMIKQLKARCVDYLLENLTVENVLPLLQYCLDCDVDERLLLKCRNIFRSNIKDMLKPGFIGSFNEKCLIFLLEDDELNAEEINLFKAVKFWARKKCVKDRPKLKVVLSHIRFPLMSLKDFVEIVVPSGYLSKKKQRNVMLMIGGQKPDGPTICKKNWPRGRIWRMDSALKDKPYQVATNLGMRETRFQIGIRIENFPSFVTSKADYYTDKIIVNDTEWYISISLSKICQNEGKYIRVTPSTDVQPEDFIAFIFGKRRNEKVSSYIVNATLKYKQLSTAEGFRILARRMDLNTTNGYLQCISFGKMTINELLNEKNGYLIDNSLEMLADVTISECDDPE